MSSNKRLVAAILTLILSIVLVIPARAEGNSITIKSALPGETYKIYKMLELVVDDVSNPTAYTYKFATNSPWSNLKNDPSMQISDGNGGTTNLWEKFFTVDDQGYVTKNGTVSNETEWTTNDLSKFATVCAQYAKNNKIDADQTKANPDTSTQVVFSNLVPGYYLVTSSYGTRAIIDTVPTDVTITEKHEANTLDKDVKEDSTQHWGDTNDARLGQTVEFETKVNITARSINVKVHDRMPEGLTFKNDVTISKVISTVNEDNQTVEQSVQLTPGTDYKVRFDPTASNEADRPDSNDTFTIDIFDSVADTSDSEIIYLKVYYSATINENIILVTENDSEITTSISPQTNTAYVSTGNNASSTPSRTTTTTHKVQILKFDPAKYTVATKTGSLLSGAVFQLKTNGGAVIPLIKINNYNYHVALSSEATVPDSEHEGSTISNPKYTTTLVSMDKAVTIWGLDADAYKLTEIDPPAGYKKLTQDVSFTVGADNSTGVNIANTTGTELPSTGGAGLYIVAGVAIVALLGLGGTAMLKRKVNGEN